MLFASINPTNLKDQSLKLLRTGGIEKRHFFEKNFFLASLQWKSVKASWLARMDRKFDDYPGFQPKTTAVYKYAIRCIMFSQVHKETFMRGMMFCFLWDARKLALLWILSCCLAGQNPKHSLFLVILKRNQNSIPIVKFSLVGYPVKVLVNT